MDLAWRTVELNDLAECSRLPLLDEAAYTPHTRPHLPLLWRDLLTTCHVESRLMEDLDRPAGDRLVGFGFMVFLSDDFLTAATSGMAPYVNAQIVRLWLAGKSPILDRTGVRLGNAGPGLNLHTFHQAFPGVVSGPSAPHFHKLVEAYFEMSQGYHIKESSIEVYTEEQLQLNLNGGFRVRTSGGRPGRAGQGPYLVGMSREEVGASLGSNVAMAFNYVVPRYFFRDAEQDLLYHALRGHNDLKLADLLCLTVAGVKKRWAGIYSRVTKVEPDWLPAENQGSTSSILTTRGAEKRRTLLNYLRSHPEELRPNLDRS